VASNALPDPSTSFGRRVHRRLRDEPVVWLTTAGADGTPQPNPVWFLWEDGSILVYNLASAHRVRHVRERPQVALHFDGDGEGGDIVVIIGRAELPEGLPPAHELPAYLAKYGARMAAVSGSPEAFSRRYSVPMRIHPRRVRGF
jgi:PPOX class probable F420-dependent enzyme